MIATMLLLQSGCDRAPASLFAHETVTNSKSEEAPDTFDDVIPRSRDKERGHKASADDHLAFDFAQEDFVLLVTYTHVHVVYYTFEKTNRFFSEKP